MQFWHCKPKRKKLLQNFEAALEARVVMIAVLVIELAKFQICFNGFSKYFY
jgi:hypothetical protein